jgi:ATP-binding cassette, subfamily B, bacterial
MSTSYSAGRATSVRPLRSLLPFLRPYRWRIAFAVLFLVLAALSSLAFPQLLRALIDHGIVTPDPMQRVVALRDHFLALFAAGCALAVFSALRLYMITWLGERVTADVRNAVYRHVLVQSPEFFETTQTGEVLSRLTADTTLMQTVLGASFSMGIRNALLALGAGVLLITSNVRVMGPALLLPIMVVLPTIGFGRRLRRLSRANQDRVADSSALAAEVINAIPTVQSYVQEPREAERFHVATERSFRAAIRSTRVRALLLTLIMTVTTAGLLWSLYRGTEAVLRGEITAGHLGQTIVYAVMLVSSVAVLAEVYGDLLRAAGASERLAELLAARSPVLDPVSPRALPDVKGGSALEFADVSFRYPSRPDRAALSGFSLKVQPGETVALVGPSGAGKSTAMALLLRFYDVNHGTISVDGVGVHQVSLGALRRRIGIVPQDAVIFSANALENIRYGRPDASEQEVIEAARAAYAHDFLSALPDGYRSFLGERGVRLSGGQRQRISIARALLKNPPLLLLDEATSALDAESERVVQSALASAMQGRTTLVIAHRLATVQKADRIVVLEAGQLVDSGTHAELIARGGLYARLAALQFEA